MGRDALVLIAGRFAQALLTVAALRLLTSLLSPAQVGGVYLMLSFAAFFGLFLISPVGNYINRKLHGWQQRGQLLARFRFFNFYVAGVTLLAPLAVMAGKVLLGTGAEIPLFHFMAAVSFYVYAVTWNQTALPALNMLGRRGAFVSFSVLSAAFGLLFSVGLVYLFGRSAQCWLYGQAAGLLLVYVVAMAALKRVAGQEAAAEPASGLMTAENLAGIRAFAVPLSVSALFMWLQTQSYRVIVERFAGPEFLGYLVVGLGIAASLAGVTESLAQQLYFPEFYRGLHGTSGEGRKAALSRLANRTVPAYIVLTAFACALSQHITRLLAAPNFQHAWKFVLIGAFIELFRMTTNILAAAAHAEMKTSALVKPYLWGGGITAAAVLAACLSGAPAPVIPLVMAGCGLVSVLVMRYYMIRTSTFSLSRTAVLKSVLLSIGFAPALLISRQENLFLGVAVVGVFGLYFVFVQWRLMTDFKETRAAQLPPDAAAGIAAEVFKGEA
jgi:O-antigen/teichoic acid export membrane protein